MKRKLKKAQLGKYQMPGGANNLNQLIDWTILSQGLFNSPANAAAQQAQPRPIGTPGVFTQSNTFDDGTPTNNVGPQGSTGPQASLQGAGARLHAALNQPSAQANQQSKPDATMYEKTTWGDRPNWAHIFPSHVLQNLGMAVGNGLGNSYQNAILRFNREQNTPVNTLPYTSNNSMQDMYGIQSFKDGGLVGDEDMLDFLFNDEKEEQPSAKPSSNVRTNVQSNEQPYTDDEEFNSLQTTRAMPRRPLPIDMEYGTRRRTVASAVGQAAEIDPKVLQAANELRQKFPGLRVTSGIRSWGDKDGHPKGRAIDLAGEGLSEAYKYYADVIVPKYGFNKALPLNHGTGPHIHAGYYQEGGKVVDDKGYLASNLQNFTKKKIIKGTKKGTPITTEGMAFPINANGITLFPDTGEYFFPDSEVHETPIMKKGGRAVTLYDTLASDPDFGMQYAKFGDKRRQLAEHLGIENYTGTAAQNEEMLRLIKSGDATPGDVLDMREDSPAPVKDTTKRSYPSNDVIPTKDSIPVRSTPPTFPKADTTKRKVDTSTKMTTDSLIVPKKDTQSVFPTFQSIPKSVTPSVDTTKAAKAIPAAINAVPIDNKPAPKVAYEQLYRRHSLAIDGTKQARYDLNKAPQLNKQFSVGNVPAIDEPTLGEKISGVWNGITERFVSKTQKEDKEAKIEVKIPQQAADTTQAIDYGYKELATVRDMKGKAKDSLVSFMNVFDNGSGGRYNVGHNILEHKNDTLKNSRAVAHFIMDGDILPSQQHTSPYADARGNIIGSSVPGKFINWSGWDTPEAFRMGYKPNSDGTYNIVYRRNKDITPEEKKAYTFDLGVRQHKYSDIDWDGVGPSTGFLAKSNYIPLKNGKATSIPYKDKGSFSRFSGGSGVYVFTTPEGKQVGVDVAGSVNVIKDVGNQLIQKYKIKPEDLTFLYHDMGSYSAKPKADAQGNLNYQQWANYNTYNRGRSGAPIAIPLKQQGGKIPTEKEMAAAQAMGVFDKFVPQNVPTTLAPTGVAPVYSDTPKATSGEKIAKTKVAEKNQRIIAAANNQKYVGAQPYKSDKQILEEAKQKEEYWRTRGWNTDDAGNPTSPSAVGRLAEKADGVMNLAGDLTEGAMLLDGAWMLGKAGKQALKFAAREIGNDLVPLFRRNTAEAIQLPGQYPVGVPSPKELRALPADDSYHAVRMGNAPSRQGDMYDVDLFDYMDAAANDEKFAMGLAKRDAGESIGPYLNSTQGDSRNIALNTLSADRSNLTNSILKPKQLTEGEFYDEYWEAMNKIKSKYPTYGYDRNFNMERTAEAIGDVMTRLDTPEGKKRLHDFVQESFREHNPFTRQMFEYLNREGLGNIEWLSGTDYTPKLARAADAEAPITGHYNSENAFHWFNDGPSGRSSYISVGSDFTPKDVRNTVEHELTHFFQRGKPSHIDEDLEQLALVPKSEAPGMLESILKGFRKPNATDLSKMNPDDISMYYYHTGMPYERDKYIREAKDYFLNGSRGKERMAFLAELRQDMVESGLIKHPYDPIDTDMLKAHYAEYMAKKGNKVPLRLYDIMQSTAPNFEILQRNINKLPAVAPIAVSAGAAAAAAASGDKKTFKKGGMTKDCYEEGGSYELTQEEIDNLLAQGYELDFE